MRANFEHSFKCICPAQSNFLSSISMMPTYIGIPIPTSTYPYVPTYICIPICSYLHLHTYMFLPTSAYLYVPTYICIPICAYLHRIPICSYLHLHTFMCLPTSAYLYVPTYMCIPIRAYLHVHRFVVLSFCSYLLLNLYILISMSLPNML